MTALLPFLLNSLVPRASDPQNKRFFLPTVLTEVPGSNSEGKLLPIEEDTWDIGAITGSAGTTITSSFASNWGSYLERVERKDLNNQRAIGNPNNPDPTLSLGDGMTKIIVEGLRNVKIEGEPAYKQIEDGYVIDLSIKYDYWDGQHGRPEFPLLGLSAPYRLSQSLCLADMGSDTCNGNASINITGTGTVDLVMIGAYIDLRVQVMAKKSNNQFQGLSVDVLSATTRGEDSQTLPVIKVRSLEINADVSGYLMNIWEDAVTKAITSPDGTGSIIKNINATMNEVSTLSGVSQQATGNMANVLNDILGTVTGTLAPSQPDPGVNPADRYLFDRMRYSLNNPDSSLFLPAVLAQSDNPSISPLDIAQVDLPDITVSPTLVFVKNKLTALNVTGLTNAKAPETALDMQGNKMHFSATLGGWNPPPAIPGGKSILAPPAVGKSDFSLTAKADGSEVTGKVDMTIQNVNLEGIIEAFGDTDEDLKLEFSQLKLTASNLQEAIVITVSVKSVFESMINGVINSDDTLGQILDTINKQLASDLPGISHDVTQYTQTAIASQLK